VWLDPWLTHRGPPAIRPRPRALELGRWHLGRQARGGVARKAEDRQISRAARCLMVAVMQSLISTCVPSSLMTRKMTTARCTGRSCHAKLDAIAEQLEELRALVRTRAG
jgi:hypothetical protein